MFPDRNGRWYPHAVPADGIYYVPGRCMTMLAREYQFIFDHYYHSMDTRERAKLLHLLGAIEDVLQFSYQDPGDDI